MMRLDMVVALFPDLESVELTAWIDRRWVQPEPRAGGDWDFDDLDVARVRLIYDLHRDIGVDDDAVPLVLSLLDQVYELRGKLKAMMRALGTQPPEVQRAVLAALEKDAP